MLALMVLCLVVVDLIMLVVYSAVEGARGSLGASLIHDKELRKKVEGGRKGKKGEREGGKE